MNQFWSGKNVLVTGHTGFKGSWLTIWLAARGARVSGYALEPPTDPSLYALASVEELLQRSYIADIRDYEALEQAMCDVRPEIVIHMAAQPLVRDSYRKPVETYAVNVMGTVHVLEAARRIGSVKALVNVTTDKCYENKGWVWGYRENDTLGGYDPYSNSKACSELVTDAYRSSFWSDLAADGYMAVASARAGNVIGGGDWAADRLVPDILRALSKNEPVVIRSPCAVRPWQHVLEPLGGYMLLAEKLYTHGSAYASAWNFGPHDADAKPVSWIVETMCRIWGGGASYIVDGSQHLHEAAYLKLDCAKAIRELGWQPSWTLDEALDAVVCWTQEQRAGGSVREACLRDIERFENLISTA